MSLPEAQWLALQYKGLTYVNAHNVKQPPVVGKYNREEKRVVIPFVHSQPRLLQREVCHVKNMMRLGEDLKIKNNL